MNSDETSTLLSIEPFEVSERREASRVRVALRGELDLATVDVVAAEDARNDGWAFTVTRGSGVVRRLFDLLDLDRLLPLEGEAP